MTDEEIFELRQKNVQRFSEFSDFLYQKYLKEDEYLLSLLKQNAKLRKFKTQEEVDLAMKQDFNPFNTFMLSEEESKEAKE